MRNYTSTCTKKIRRGGKKKNTTKLEKSQEIPDFVRASAGNDANPATVPSIYRSWQCCLLCLPIQSVSLSLSLYVCVLARFWYCVCVWCKRVLYTSLSLSLSPPDGWMTDMLLYTHPSQKPLANEAYIERHAIVVFFLLWFPFAGVVATWNSSAAPL